MTTDASPWYDQGQRLRPPACLGETERAVFIDLIGSVPAAQFVASDLALLARWCEATVMAETAADELREGGMVTADGKVSPWFTIHSQATKTLKDLALRLRLSPQGRANKAPKTMARPMTAYERLALEDDDEAQQH